MDGAEQPSNGDDAVEAETTGDRGAQGDAMGKGSSEVGEPVAVSAAALAAEIAELKAEVASLREQAEKRLVAWQRAQADYQNLKRRSRQEVGERATYAVSGLVLELLPVVDDLDRAFAADDSVDVPQDSEAWVEGIRLIQRKLYALLERAGVQPIAAVGQPFDPNFHEAVGRAPGPANQILTQAQKGYLLGQRVLRPSLVIVGEGADEGGDADAGAAEGEQAGSPADEA